MNIVKRLLIVIGNIILAPIMLPIQFLISMCYVVKRDIGFKECIEAFVEGVGEGVQSNIRFIKSGDINEFRLI